MLYLCVGSAIVYIISMASGNYTLYNLLCFHQESILHGQVWRLITFPLTSYHGNILFQFISLLCYYSLGRAIEAQWGTFKFNLFYGVGVLMMDVYGMIFGCQASVYYLNMSLFLSYATLYPQATFLLFFIIPVKAWIFALLDLLIILMGMISYPYTAYNFFPIISLANYFLFFGSEVINVLPMSLRSKLRRTSAHRHPAAGPKVIQFRVDTPPAAHTPNYNHKCTVCGRTDVTNPELEFRYCSRCKGYYCYCQEHISSHTHIQ